MPNFVLRSDLSAVVGDQKIIAANIGPSGQACLLLVSPKFEKDPFGREERKGFASFPFSKSKRHYPATFICFDGQVLQRTELSEVNIAFPFVQPLPDGEILLVGARCHYREGDPEENAVVFNRRGEIVRRFVLGDGINDVQTTTDGLVWVSYFDEGVFGNYGWDKPMGHAGLVCFDMAGHVAWEFEPPAGLDAIADCYALNVAADSVWACYYTDFPVVKVDFKRRIHAWRNTVGGAHALAVDGRRVALWGGYREKHSRCVVQEIGDDTLKDPIELAVGFPGAIDSTRVRIFGRGATFHAFVGTSWCVCELATLR